MLALAALVVLGLLGAFVVAPRFSGCDFSVEFSSAKTLKAGDPVIRQGIRIGEVRRVDFGENGGVRVDARLSREHRDRVRSDDLFLVVNPSFPLNAGGMALEVFPGDEQAPPLKSGAVLKGCNSRVEVWLGQAGDQIQDVTRTLREAGQALSIEVQKLWDSEAGKDLQDRLSELKEEADRVASGYYLEHADEVQAARDRLEAGYEEATAKGKAEIAEKFREAVEMLDSQQGSK